MDEPSAPKSRRRAYAGVVRRLPWPDLAVVLLLAVLCVLFFWRILTPNRADRAYFPPGDFADQFYSFTVYEASRWQEGKLPLWNPYTFSGHPFLADVQSAIFYPISLAVVLASLAVRGYFSLVALEWEAVVHFFLASLFTYLFARRRLGNRGAALVSAVTFAYGGYLTGYPPLQLAVLETDVWLPLILLCLDILFDAMLGHQKVLWSLAAGVAWGVALLAGHPQSAMYVFYVSLLYFAFRAWPWRQDWPRKLGLCALFLAVGFGLAAAQYIPSLEYMRLSVRASANYETLSGGFPLRDVIQLLIPGVVSLWSPLYVGVFPLILAGAALAARRAGLRPCIYRTRSVRRDRSVLFWGLLALGSLMLSFGRHAPVYRLFYLVVPGFSLFKSQERAAFVFSFAMALLAGYGLRSLLPQTDVKTSEVVRTSSPQTPEVWATMMRRRRGLSRVIVVLGLMAVLMTLVSFGRWVDQGLAGDSSWAAVTDRWIFLVILLALSWVVLRLMPDAGGTSRGARPIEALVRRLTQRWWMALAVALIVFDLFAVNGDTNVQPSYPVDEPGPILQALLSDPGTFRVENEWRLPGNYGDVYRLEDTWGSSPLYLRRYRDLVRTLPKERVRQLLNVKYVVTWHGDLQQPHVLAQEPKGDEQSYLHRLDQVAPRAAIVHQAEVITDDEAALQRLADPSFDPEQTVILAEPSHLPLTGGSPADSSVQVVSRQPERIVLEADLVANGLLVLSEVYYPGWRARVDGEETRLYRANYTLRAVALTPGSHRVEMIFDPLSVKAGLGLSGVTVLLSIALVAGAAGWGRRN